MAEVETVAEYQEPTMEELNHRIFTAFQAMPKELKIEVRKQRFEKQKEYGDPGIHTDCAHYHLMPSGKAECAVTTPYKCKIRCATDKMCHFYQSEGAQA